MDTTRREFVHFAAAGAAIAASAATQASAANPTTAFKSPRDGLWVAALTPVDRNAKFDAAAYKDMLALWKSQGADGVLVLGTTGEGQSFSLEERRMIAEFAIKNKSGLDIIVGTGTANFPDTIALSKHAADVGADSVLIVPPYYEKNPKGDGVLRYFDRIFAEVKSPIRYYHIPKVTGVPITDMNVWQTLGQHPNFAGVKDSNGEATEYDNIVKQLPNFAVFTGTDPLIEQALSHRNGAILASGNLYTRQLAAVWSAYRAGKDLAPPLANLKAAQALLRQPGYGQGMSATKYALSVLMDSRQTFARPPEDDVLTESEKANIRSAVTKLKAMG